MPLILRRGYRRKVGLVGACLLVTVACKHVVSDAPITPGPPIPAEPEADLQGMDAECAGLIDALGTYGKCPNLDDRERNWTQRTIEVAQRSFAAGKEANPDEPSQKAIAAACRRATLSIKYATERCQAGPRPKVDY